MQRVHQAALSAAILLAFGGSAAAQPVLQGPVSNPANGSRYYLLSASSWQAAQTFARSIGGDLATIDDAAENTFLTNIFAAPENRKIFIGLNDDRVPSAFEWSDGSGPAYRNWRPGEPRNNTDDNFAQLLPDGTWDARFATNTPFALIEVTGPLRVPQEYPDLAGAINILPVAGTREIALGPGTFTLDGIVPAGDLVIRGVSRQSTTVLAGASLGFTLSGTRLTLESLEVRAAVNRTPFALTSDATVTAYNCSFLFPNISPSTPAFFCNSQGNFALTLDNCEVRTPGPLVQGPTTDPVIDVTLRNTLVVARSGTAGNGIRFRATNSTLVGTSTGAFFNSPLGSQSITNSILSVPGTPSLAGLAASYSILPSFVPGPGNIVAQPQFVAPGVGDYSLRPESPAVNAARAENLLAARPRIARDAMMNQRVVAGAPDIGALERQPFNALCPADYNNDLTIDINDFFAYLSAYSAGCP